jgi:hydroxymethylbilane synthase
MEQGGKVTTDAQLSGSDVLLTIGTRGRPLAMAQAHEVRGRLTRAHNVAPERIVIRPIRTSGDIIQDRALLEAGGKGLFTKELEEALLAGSVDIAVHSSKDVPTFLPDSTWLSSFLPREDPRDAFISRKAKSLADLPPGSVVGTASLRRQAMVLRLRPDLKVNVIRGNVQTRLRKLAEGEADATLLAMAGLKRVGLEKEATRIFEIDEFLPAVGQGAIAIESRRDDERVNALVAAIGDSDTEVALSAERSFLALLDGSCRTPIGGHCRVNGDRIDFRGLIISPDGKEWFETAREGLRADAVELGAEAARELRELAGEKFFTLFGGV